MDTYTQTVEALKTKFAAFVMDAEAGASNKSSALRARKMSMEIRKDLAGFRKASVSCDKSNTKHRAPKADAPAPAPAVAEAPATPAA
jgi:hypothetical protein